MKRAGLACVLYASFLPLLLAQTQPNATSRVLRTESGDKTVVRRVGERGQSIVDFSRSHGRDLCSADYSAAPGSHGFLTAKAA